MPVAPGSHALGPIFYHRQRDALGSAQDEANDAGGVLEAMRVMIDSRLHYYRHRAVQLAVTANHPHIRNAAVCGAPTAASEQSCDHLRAEREHLRVNQVRKVAVGHSY